MSTLGYTKDQLSRIHDRSEYMYTFLKELGEKIHMHNMSVPELDLSPETADMIKKLVTYVENDPVIAESCDCPDSSGCELRPVHGKTMSFCNNCKRYRFEP